jgi:hypothetical protein
MFELNDIDRRQFLKWTGIGTGTLLLGSLVYRVGFHWRQSPGKSYEVLSPQEANILTGVVDAVFPGEAGGPNALPSGLDLGLVDYYDKYLAGAKPGTRDFGLIVLHAIDDFSRVSSLDWVPFHKRSRRERIELLNNWQESALLVRRAGFKFLKYELASEYCSHERVREVLGVEFICGVDS